MISASRNGRLAVPTTAAPIRVAVIFATKGRPQAIPELIDLLENQSLAPTTNVISATAASDLEVPPATDLNVEYVFGPLMKHTTSAVHPSEPERGT